MLLWRSLRSRNQRTPTLPPSVLKHFLPGVFICQFGPNSLKCKKLQTTWVLEFLVAWPAIAVLLLFDTKELSGSGSSVYFDFQMQYQQTQETPMDMAYNLNQRNNFVIQILKMACCGITTILPPCWLF